MNTLRDWVITYIGQPVFYEEVRNAQGAIQRQTVQYDWAFICAALLLIVSLWGFVTLIRLLFSHRKGR